MLGGISIWQLLIILAIIMLLFGTKKLRNIGGDLGGAVKGFKSAMKDEEKAGEKSDAALEDSNSTIDAQAQSSSVEDKKDA